MEFTVCKIDVSNILSNLLSWPSLAAWLRMGVRSQICENIFRQRLPYAQTKNLKGSKHDCLHVLVNKPTWRSCRPSIKSNSDNGISRRAHSDSVIVILRSPFVILQSEKFRAFINFFFILWAGKFSPYSLPSYTFDLIYALLYSSIERMVSSQSADV